MTQVVDPRGPLLEARNLHKRFPVRSGLLRRPVAWVHAVDGVSFQIWPGQTLSLVGESGCGKSTTARLLLQLERPTNGQILWQGQDLTRLKRSEWPRYRKAVQAVFQDPWSSLNPRMRVEAIVGEPLEINEKLSTAERRRRIAEVLEQVGLHPAQARLYPHEFSGGQRQRIAIARALTLKPRVMVLDEPVSALDVSFRAQIMNLLKDLQTDLGLSYALIAHDFATVRYMSHQTAVMYLGQFVEQAPTARLFVEPKHPYTQALIAASQPARPGEAWETGVSGEVPSPINPPAGCRFHTRCPFAMDHCRTQPPPLQEVAPGHLVACHLYPAAAGPAAGRTEAPRLIDSSA